MNFVTLSTLLGFLGGIVLFFLTASGSTDQYQIFWSPSSAYLVMGCTTASAFISYNTKDVLGGLMCIIRVFGGYTPINRQSLTTDVNTFIELSKKIRATGLTNLEGSVPASFLRVPIVKYGMEMLAANYPPNELRKMISDFMVYDYEIRSVRSQVLRTMGTLAPACGLVGTVMGMVIILSDFGGDFAVPPFFWKK